MTAHRTMARAWPWLAAAGVALQLWFLFDRALWIDEVFSLYHARHAIAFIWGQGWQLETSPPLYYSLLWAWTHLVGPAEWSARLLSWLLMAGATCYVARAGQQLGGRRVEGAGAEGHHAAGVGGIAALLFACNPLIAQYALEIRPYALLLFEVSLAVSSLVGLLLRLRDGGLTDAAAVARCVAPLWLAGVAMTYTHATAPFIVAAFSATLALYGWRSRATRGFWIGWGAGNGLLLLALTPEFLVMLSVIGTNPGGLASYPSPTDPMWIYIVVRALIVGEYSYGNPTTKLLGLVVVAASAWALWRLRHDRLALAIGLLPPVLGLSMLFVASLMQPILIPRTAMWIIVPQTLFLGCACGTLHWRRRSVLPVALLAGWLLMLQMGVANGHGRTTWRPSHAILEHLARLLKPGDEVVAFDPETLCVLDFYADAPLRQAPRWVLDRGATQRFRSWQRIDLGCNRSGHVDDAAIRRQLVAGHALWLLAWNDLQAQDLAAVLAALPPTVNVTRAIRWKELDVAVRVELPRP